LNEPPKTIRLADGSDIFKGKTEIERKRTKKKKRIPHESRRFSCSIVKQRKPRLRRLGSPKSRRAVELQIAIPSLLREGERGQKLDEDELKYRARAIEAKFLEFDVQGTLRRINPGPVVTTFEFKPEAGIKYNRITGLTEDLCLALQADPS